MNVQTPQRIAVVTGASAGIGKSTARMLAGRGWHVICVGRDPARCAAAETEIGNSASPDARVDWVRGDFTEMREVQRVAGQIRGLTERLDVLINNAGGVRDKMYVTQEGLEATWAANHLAPFLLTREVMPLLKASAAGAPSGLVRVIAVSSSGHEYCQGIHWDDLNMFDGFVPVVAYCQAKLANILFTRELARRAAPFGIIAQCMHPGRVTSNFASHGDAAMQSYMEANATTPPDEPAKTLVWLATAPETGYGSGRYFYELQEVAPAAQALDDAAAARLWEASEQQLRSVGIGNPQ